MPAKSQQSWRTSLTLSRFPFSRRAFWGGAASLAALEVFSSLARAHFLPDTPFFLFPELWLGLAMIKGLVFGPILGCVTLRSYRLWQQKRWDEACHQCLRGGFALCVTQGFFALLCFLCHNIFPVVTWLAASWTNFALWLTLNVALIWALLLLVAGFLLPSDARKTIQVSEKVRF